jgi:hypothetical protein
LDFSFLQHAFCREPLRCCVVDASYDWVDFGVRGFVSLFALGGLFRLRDTADEPDKSVAVSFGRNGGYLRLCVCKTFDKVLHAFDDGVLGLVRSNVAVLGKRTYMCEAVNDTEVVYFLARAIILVCSLEAAIIRVEVEVPLRILQFVRHLA